MQQSSSVTRGLPDTTHIRQQQPSSGGDTAQTCTFVSHYLCNRRSWWRVVGAKPRLNRVLHRYPEPWSQRHAFANTPASQGRAALQSSPSLWRPPQQQSLGTNTDVVANEVSSPVWVPAPWWVFVCLRRARSMPLSAPRCGFMIKFLCQCRRVKRTSCPCFHRQGG